MPPAPSERGNRRRRRRQARGELLKAALELARESPFREVSVERIAAAAGISRSAFYLHFADKHELLLAALEDLGAGLERLAADWWSREGPPAERAQAALAQLISACADNADLLRLATEVATYDAEVRERWLELIRRLVAAMADRIRAEQRGGLIMPSVKPQPTAEGLIWMTERCCGVYLLSGERTAEELVEALAPVWTAGLYPGVIPAEQLRPGPLGSRGPWGMAEPDGGAAEGTGAGS